MSKHFGVLLLSIILFSVIIAEEHKEIRKKRQNSCGGCGTASQQGYMNYPTSYQPPQYQPTYQSSGQSSYSQQYPVSYLNPTGQTYQYPSYTSSQQYQAPPQYQATSQYQPAQYQPPQYQPPQYQPTQYQPAQYQQNYQQSIGCGPSMGGSSCSCPSGFTICFRYYGPSRCCSKK